MTTYASVTDRFMAKVEPIPFAGCWIWVGSTRNQYGQFRYGSKYEYAHRASWLLFRGEIPPGLWVLHKCDNKYCVNPDHLYIGDRIDNVADAMARGLLFSGTKGSTRQLQSHCFRGHEYSQKNTWTYGRKRHCKTCHSLSRSARELARASLLSSP